MNVMEQIKKTGDDGPFTPRRCSKPTDCSPGSLEKIEVLRLRVLAGEELFHEDDRDDCEGLGAVQVGRRNRSRDPSIRTVRLDDVVHAIAEGKDRRHE